MTAERPQARGESAVERDDAPRTEHDPTPFGETIARGPGPTPASHERGAAFSYSASASAGGLPSSESAVDVPAAPFPRPFGDYELLGEIARGGMGVVYRARQLSLNRQVALKMILAARLGSASAIERFNAEAEAAARLDHPGIVPIYQVGQHAGQYFFSMGLVEGGSLADQLATGSLTPRAAARLVRAIAEAVHYAHSRNIVHRDLKPANILLTDDGQPKVTDFGLAKVLGEDSQLSVAGQVLGTPSYMSPEQAAGRTAEVGPLSDVYALGAILYALVTGQPPFQGTTIVETLSHVVHDEPRPPQQLAPQIDLDLATICLKCLEKNPANRYTSAAELASELRRFLDGEPIVARPLGWFERAGRWARRRPAQAAALASGVVAAVALIGMGVDRIYQRRLESANVQLKQSAEELERANANLQAAHDQLDRLFYLRRVQTALTEWTNDEPIRARKLLDDCPESYRQWEWHYVSSLGQVDTFTGLAGDVRAVGFSADGKSLVGCSAVPGAGQMDIVAWDTATRRELHRARLEGKNGGAIALDHSATVLATADYADPFHEGPTAIRIWETSTGTPLRVLDGHFGVISSIVFSPDGRRLATISRVTRAAEYGVPAPPPPPPPGAPGPAAKPPRTADSPPRRAAAGPKPIASPQPTPPGTAVPANPAGTASAVSTVKIWDAESGDCLHSWSVESRVLGSATFSSDSRRLAASSERGILVWDVETGKESARLPHATSVQALAFAPGGNQLALATVAALRIVQLSTGEPPRDIPLKQPLNQIQFLPDGRQLAGCGHDRAVMVWDTLTGVPIRTYRGHSADVQKLAVSADGLRLASGGFDRTIKVWDLTQSQEVRMLSASGALDAARQGEPTHPTTQAVISPDGRQIVAACRYNAVSAGQLQVFDAHQSRLERIVDGHAGSIAAIEFDPDGAYLASAGTDHVVNVWDPRTWQPLTVYRGHQHSLIQLACGAGGRVASLGVDAQGGLELRIWEALSGRDLATIRGPELGVAHVGELLPGVGPRTQLAFGPSGDWVVSAAEVAESDGAKSTHHRPSPLRVWSTSSGQLLRTIEADSRDLMTSLAVSPDGRRIVSARYDRSQRASIVTVWDSDSGKALVELEQLLGGDKSRVDDLAFSPDGRRIAGATTEAVVLWDGNTGEEILTLRSPTDRGRLRSVAFSADGRQIVAAHTQGIVMIWDSHQPRHDERGDSETQ